MLQLGVSVGIVFLAGLVLILIPTKVWYVIFKLFSFNKFGVRYIRRRRDNTDTLGNFFLFISLLICLAFWIIPFYKVVYIAWLTFAFFATFGQAARVSLELNVLKAKLCQYGVILMFGFGVITTIGLVNGFASDAYIPLFVDDVFSMSIADPYYYFVSPTFSFIVMQFIVLFIPCYCLWAQFKYMRLEDTFKARWIVTYMFKILVVCAVMFGFAYGGFELIKIAFQLEAMPNIAIFNV